MQQDIVADAAALKGGLAQDGHIVVPGILFDFGKADVKPESEGALKEIAKMLQANPATKVWVVGHTDYVGSAEANVALSNARAAAVVRALTTQMGIDPKRLAAFGNGPYAPVASNKTDEGRARNRRVELVAQPQPRSLGNIEEHRQTIIQSQMFLVVGARLAPRESYTTAL